MIRTRHQLALFWAITVFFAAFPVFETEAGQRKFGSSNAKTNVSAERPFDAVNIFGELGRSLRLQNTDETKLWWERMVRGEVGKERFLILCALKDGNWKTMADIRNYVEFQMRETYAGVKMYEMLTLMALTPKNWHPISNQKMLKVGEGWLEKNREADPRGIYSKWRIEPSVLPLLYFLLMGCPEENRCR